jgi:hypothetical protein
MTPMHDQRNSKEPVKPHKPVTEKPEAWKEYLKAMEMSSFVYKLDDLKSVIQEKAYKKVKDCEKGVPPMPKNKTAVIPDKNELNDNARRFAIKLTNLSEQEKPGKIRRMEAVISRAKDPDSIHVQLCRFFPKTKKPTQEVIRELVGVLGKWDLNSFKEMFHVMRIYYEACDAGFNLKEKRNDGKHE